MQPATEGRVDYPVGEPNTQQWFKSQISQQDSGVYQCVAHNAAGTASDAIVVQVQAPSSEY